jgi:hypothetical protein
MIGNYFKYIVLIFTILNCGNPIDEISADNKITNEKPDSILIWENNRVKEKFNTISIVNCIKDRLIPKNSIYASLLFSMNNWKYSTHGFDRIMTAFYINFKKKKYIFIPYLWVAGQRQPLLVQIIILILYFIIKYL